MCLKGEESTDICPRQHSSPLLPKQLSSVLFLRWTVCILTVRLKATEIMTPICFCDGCFAFDFHKTSLNPPRTVSERGLWRPFVFVSQLMGGAQLILWKWTGELLEHPCKCTSTTLVSGGPFPVAWWITTMFLPGVRVLMWGACVPPQVHFMATICSLKEQTGTDKIIWFVNVIMGCLTTHGFLSHGTFYTRKR